MLTSPPGLGKTHLAERELKRKFQEANVQTVVFDCSDDRLVLQSLTDLLEESFHNKNQKSFLIADEFHLLSARQKMELRDWCIPHLSWLRILLIGNRVLRIDKDIFDKLEHLYSRTGADRDEKSKVHVKLIEAGLTPDAVAQVVKSSSKSGTCPDDLRNWCAVLQIIFGPVALSLRYASHLNKALSISKKSSRNDLIAIFRNSLLTHMPLLSTPFAEALARAFILAKNGDGSSMSSQPLLLAFCNVAVIAAKDGRKCNKRNPPSFIAFQRRQIPQKWHPEDRAREWIRMISEAYGLTPPHPIPSDDYVWVDQDPFPYIATRQEVPLSLRTTQTVHAAAGVRFGYLSTEELRHLVVHQHPVDWLRVQKQWEQEPVSDLLSFEALLQVK